MRLIRIKFNYPDETSLRFLEEQCLSYSEIISCYECYLSKQMLRKFFKRFNIIHKTQYERIYCTMIKNPSLLKETNSTLANYFKCSRNTILKAREELKKNDRNDN